MASVTPFLESINSGEFSPRMEARVGFGRYPNAAKMLRNCVLYPQGGFTRRPGTRYVAEVKTSANATRLFPFEYSIDQSYIVEAGNAYMRFYRRQGRLDVADTDAAITNGTFTSNITDWDDLSSSTAYARVNSQTIVGATSTASQSPTYPADLVSGDMLLLFVTVDSHAAKTITTPTGFTQLYNTVGGGDLRRGACYYRIADGTETGTFTVTLSGTAAELLTVTYVIKKNSSSAPEAGTSATGSGTTPNPPSVTPSWGSKNTTWIAAEHHQGSGISGVTAPTNFNLLTAYTVVGGANQGLAQRWQAASSQDPGTFTIASAQWIAQTVAIEPVLTPISHDSTNGRLKLPGEALLTSCAEQDVTVGAGNISNVHVLKFTVAGARGGVCAVRIGTTSGDDDILTEIEVGIGYHLLEFTPGATTFYVQFCNSNDPVQDIYIDDVSLIDNAALEITTPYATADLADLKVYQSDDSGGISYYLHPSYWPRKLIRRGHRSWSLEEVPFDDGPYLSSNDGTDVNLNQLIPNPLFENGLDGWTDASSGDGFIEHKDTTQLVELDPGTAGGSGFAILRESVNVSNSTTVIVHILTAGSGPIDLSIGYEAGGSTYTSTTINAGWHSYEITPTASELHIEFSYNQYDNANAAVAACLVYTQDARLMDVSDTTGEVTLTATGFTPFVATDVGRILRLTHPGHEPGWGIVTAVASTTSATLQIVREIADTVPTEDWQWGVWDGLRGYPEVMGFFDGRAVLANTAYYPKSLWFSQSSDNENMRADSWVSGGITVEDDDAIALTLASSKIDPILWLNGQDNLIVGTSGGQWVINSSGAVITPTDRSAKQHTEVPSTDVFLGVNDISIYIDRSGRKAYEVGYKFDNGKYVARDLTVLADHIFRSKASEMVYQAAPYGIIWCRRADGRLASLSYDREHQVLGWSQTILGGAFSSGDPVVTSIATIPGASDSNQVHDSDERDELWMIVKRTINGATVQYVEFMERFYEAPLREDYATETAWRAAVVADQDDAFYVDCGLTYDSTATTTITGLSHLEGGTVKVLADGKVVSDAVVSSGQITLSSAASVVQVGLSYEHRYESLKLAVGGEAGTAVTKAKMITAVGMVLLDTGHESASITTVEYDGPDGRRVHDLYKIGFIREQDDPTAAVPLFTGEIVYETEGGGSPDARIYCEGTAPLPFSVIGFAPVVTTSNTPASRN